MLVSSLRALRPYGPSYTPRARDVARCNAASPADWQEDTLRLDYMFSSSEVTINDDAAAPLQGYLTEEVPAMGKPRTTRSLLLLPAAAGWRHPPVRRLADRLAVFCSCLVLVPDMLRGAEPWAPAAPRVGPAYSSWLGSIPPSHTSSCIRESIVFLRADQSADRLAILGVGLGGGLALEHAALPDTYRAAAVICPEGRELGSVRLPAAPLLCVFGEGTDASAAAAGARAALALDDVSTGLAAARQSVASSGAEVRASAAAAVATPRPTGKIPSKSTLGKLRVAELRLRLRSLSLSDDGRKAELVARLRDALASPDPAALDSSAWRDAAHGAAGSGAGPRAEPGPDVAEEGEAMASAEGALTTTITAAGGGEGGGEPAASPHLVLQFRGAQEWAHPEGPVRGDADRDHANGGVADAESDDDAGSGEDAMLMIEAWLNAHFDAGTPTRTGTLSVMDTSTGSTF